MMTDFAYPHYPTAIGYMTEQTRARYIQNAVECNVLPENAHRMSDIISLSASNDVTKPIQFWQLYSVLGQQRIVELIAHFYRMVFDDEPWFRSVFARVGGVDHHVNTQAAMWIDVMGGGPTYHGGDFRLSFHHTHNAMNLMNEKGAQRWVKLMVDTLNNPSIDLTEDQRVRPSINTFLSHFLSKYEAEFDFVVNNDIGETNSPFKRRINFTNMTDDAIEALSAAELKEALIARGVDVNTYENKADLVKRAMRF